MVRPVAWADAQPPDRINDRGGPVRHPPSALGQMTTGGRVSRPLDAAAELSVAGRPDDGPGTIDELARAISCGRRASRAGALAPEGAYDRPRPIEPDRWVEDRQIDPGGAERGEAVLAAGQGAKQADRVEEARALKVPVVYLFTAGQEDYYSRLGWSALTRTEHHREVVIMHRRTGA